MENTNITLFRLLAKIAPIKKTKTVESQFMYRRIDKHRHSFSTIINDCQMETMLLFITYFLYIRECKILHYFDYLMYTKKIFQRKFLKQWRVGNRLADLGSYTFTVR